MENVEADHMKEARSQDIKMTAEETHWSICADTEPKQEEKQCKGEAVWRRQGRRKRVMKGKKRWRRCTVGGEDVTQPLLYTDTFTHKHSYAETLLRTNRHTHTHKRLHTPQGFHTHTHFCAQMRFHTQTPYDPFTFFTLYMLWRCKACRKYFPVLLRIGLHMGDLKAGQHRGQNLIFCLGTLSRTFKKICSISFHHFWYLREEQFASEREKRETREKRRKREDVRCEDVQ